MDQQTPNELPLIALSAKEDAAAAIRDWLRHMAHERRCSPKTIEA